MATKNTAFVPLNDFDDEADPIVNIQHDRSLPKRKRPFLGRRGRCRRFLKYFAYCFAVLAIFGVILFLIFDKFDSLIKPFTTFDLGNHNYSMLVTNYKAIGEELFASLNQGADPCEDFYQYACGSFLAATVLDSETARLGKAFTSIENKNIDVILEIVDDQWPLVTPYFQSCNQSYQSGNFSQIDRYYQSIIGANTTIDLFRRLSKLRVDYGLDLTSFAFSFFPQPDLYTPTTRILTITQATLPLPGPDYYVASLNLINPQEYYRYIIGMFALSPKPIGIDEAISIVSYEAAVSKILVSGAREHDPSQMYRKIQWSDLSNFLPREIVNYLNSFSLLPLARRNVISIQDSDYFNAYSEILNGVSLAALKNVILYGLFRQTYPLLGPAYFDTQRGLDSMLEGTSHKVQTQDQRQRMCAEVVAEKLQLLVGHYFVQKVGIDDTFKAHVTEIVDNLQEAFARRLDNNTLFDTMTKSAAEGKLSALKKQICYPDDWSEVVDFELRLGLPLVPNDFIGNSLRISKTYDTKAFELLGTPIDVNSWLYDKYKTRRQQESPTIVNAFYSPDFNRITIPAGITRPPFLFSSDWRKAPLSSIYGGLGSILGHEITHGYDSWGRHYGADGSYFNWMTLTSANAFVVASQCLVDFYGSLETQVTGLYVNGETTLGENIADLGGLETAFDAFLIAKSQLNSVDLVDYQSALNYVFPQFNENQLFFLFYASNWCEKSTDEAVVELVESNPHAPAAQRVQGTLMNMKRFRETFNCKVGSGYYAPDICSIW